jgi:hypothetical protein
MFEIILQSLLSGNAVIIVSGKLTKELSKLRDYLSTLNKNILQFMTELNYKEKGNSIITFDRKNVGLYFNDFSNISIKLLTKFRSSITLPIGDINYAK